MTLGRTIHTEAKMTDASNQRLRDVATLLDGQGRFTERDWINQAQAEIDRLTAERDEAVQQAEYYHKQWQEDGTSIEAAEAERDRLTTENQALARKIIGLRPTDWEAERDRLREELADYTADHHKLEDKLRSATSREAMLREALEEGPCIYARDNCECHSCRKRHEALRGI